MRSARSCRRWRRFAEPADLGSLARKAAETELDWSQVAQTT